MRCCLTPNDPFVRSSSNKHYDAVQPALLFANEVFSDYVGRNI